jgi:hypothetical protein
MSICDRIRHNSQLFNGIRSRQSTALQQTRHIAAAAAWGLFPEWDATYLNYSGGHNPDVCHKATYQVPENNAFWSITIHGNDGFMKSENCIVNSSNVKLNDNGTFTVHFGSKELCGNVPNRLDVTEGWNFLMRVYRPGESVLNESYKIPRAEPVENANAKTSHSQSVNAESNNAAQSTLATCSALDF